MYKCGRLLVCQFSLDLKKNRIWTIFTYIYNISPLVFFPLSPKKIKFYPLPEHFQIWVFKTPIGESVNFPLANLYWSKKNVRQHKRKKMSEASVVSNYSVSSISLSGRQGRIYRGQRGHVVPPPPSNSLSGRLGRINRAKGSFQGS